MAQAGVDISQFRSKTVEKVRQVEFDYIVTVCDNASDKCPVFPGAGKVIHQGFDDPPRLAAIAATDARRSCAMTAAGNSSA
jgi:arsenate reductase